MKEEVFALVDCNSFYCSCERLFRPELQNKPVIVLSNNDGCAVSRTDEAKALGVKMGEPYFKIKELCSANQIEVFSSNYVLYGDMSRRVMRVLADFSPEIEIYSIDEAFLSLKGLKQDALLQYAEKIRDTVFKFTGIPVSIGLGPTKVLAKAANQIAKKNKLATGCIYSLLGGDKIEQDKADQDLKNLKVQELWGVGKKSTEKLNRIGIFTAFELKYSNQKMIQDILTIVGRRIVEELCGHSCLSLELVEQDKKQMISSRSFGQPVFTLDDLRESIANHVSSICEKLRAQKSIASSLTVFVQTNPHKKIPQYYNSTSMHLLSGSSVTNKMISHSFALLDKVFKAGFEYKKAGVIVNDISKKDCSQIDFFNHHDSTLDDLMMKTLDHVNKKEGSGALKYAACGTTKFWKMLSEMKSQSYTTRWSELLRVG